ncbi:hypothetical protein GALMADRAFT_127188 [Galerina marginata CBS 339.88]|uniref:PLAC8-domain-containing protein n=1 Tax=Galerina marginata (strain CBS 339.88) TaxID=685588 RepID=A0A067SK12_GALM3|nr:hypothetical protein GALMADRAFT_127188 [Galerina marginata CBS 339.88]
MAHIQPTANPGMALSGGNRNVKNLPVSVDGREWSEGLFGCFGDVGTCILACFCPCVVYNNVRHRYTRLTATGSSNPHRTEHGGVCSPSCMTHALISLCCFSPVLQAWQRKSIRAHYNIKGGDAEDCCTALCCGPCELTQESRELELEERSLGLSSDYRGEAYVMLASEAR